jgi:mycofactocin system glycosyltransferase
MTTRRYRLDDGAQRHGHVLVGGSPLKLFRLTGAGSQIVDRIEAGEAVAESGLVASLVDAGAVHPVGGSAGRFGRDDVTVVTPAFGRVPPPRDGAIVVDDGSDPPIPDATARLDPNRGPAAARNAGLARVTTPLVAFVDADVHLPEGWLDALLPHFDDDRVAMAAPRVRSAPGTSTLDRYEREHSPLDLGSRPGRIRAGSRISYVPAAAVVCRVDAIRAIGGFDETLRFGEDVDLVWRLDESGRRLRYEPASVVTHDPRPTWQSWFDQRVGYGSSAAPLSRRHPGSLAPLRMSGWSVGAWVSGVLAHPVLGVAIGAGSAAALVRKLDDVPPRAAFLLAWRGNLAAGGQIAAAIRRAWWPIVLLAGLRSRRARLGLLLAAVAARHPLALADDVAYSVGIWRGVVRDRTAAPLVPEISSWPGRRSPSRHDGAR